MSFDSLILLAIVAVPVVLGYFMYVSLIRTRNAAQTALSDIDIQLRRRLDVVPNLLKIARQFMTHEKTLLEEVTRLRTQAAKTPCTRDPEKGFKLNNQLAEKMGGIMVAVENYPDLKSDATLGKAMDELALIEEDIASSRRLYNSAVLTFNNKADIFPYSLIASMLSMQRMVTYEDQDKAAISRSIDASDYL